MGKKKLHADNKKLHACNTPNECKHLPERNYAWIAADGVVCIACCDCGAVLKGAFVEVEHEHD